MSQLNQHRNSCMHNVFWLVHPGKNVDTVSSMFHAAAISDIPVLTIWCWNQAMCFFDVFGYISKYGRTHVFCVSVCRLCESWSSIRTQVGAGRDFDMPSDSGARVVWHCPQVVADVEWSAEKLASSYSLPSDYDLSNVLDHISWLFARRILVGFSLERYLNKWLSCQKEQTHRLWQSGVCGDAAFSMPDWCRNSQVPWLSHRVLAILKCVWRTAPLFQARCEHERRHYRNLPGWFAWGDTFSPCTSRTTRRRRPCAANHLPVFQRIL